MKKENLTDTLTLAKRMVYLAWQACGGPYGMGFLQDRGSSQTEDQIWDHAMGNRDYALSRNRPGEIYCDYVQGRMMKLSIRFTESTIDVNGGWRPDYQGFSSTYKTPEDLFDAAMKSLKTETLGL